MRKFVIKFRGVDDFNRPVFKVVDSAIYLGSTTTILPDLKKFPNGTKEEINEYFRNNQHEIEFFGNKFNCEPHGGNSEKWQFEIIN